MRPARTHGSRSSPRAGARPRISFSCSSGRWQNHDLSIVCRAHQMERATDQRRGPRPCRHDARRNEPGLDAARRAVELLRALGREARIARLDRGQTDHERAEEQTDPYSQTHFNITNPLLEHISAYRRLQRASSAIISACLVTAGAYHSPTPYPAPCGSTGSLADMVLLEVNRAGKVRSGRRLGHAPLWAARTLYRNVGSKSHGEASPLLEQRNVRSSLRPAYRPSRQ